MTCIVGIIKGDEVLIGADSAGVGGGDITIRRDKKVFCNNGFVIGCTSSFRMIQLLQFSFKPPKIKRKSLFEYMCTDFINEVRKCFVDGGYIQRYEDGDEKGGSFLVGVNGRLFNIQDDFQVAESVLDFDAIGCGYAYALGSLLSTENAGLTEKKRLKTALKSASRFSTGVEPPFVFCCA